MAEVGIRGRREDPIYPLREDLSPPENLPVYIPAREQAVDLRPYLLVLWTNRRIIALAVTGVVALVAILTSFVLKPVYRATAILKPIPRSATASRLVGVLGGVGGESLGAFASLATGGGGGLGADEAQEYMTILQSFAFNLALINRHHLVNGILKPRKGGLFGGVHRDPRWRDYKRMMGWFSCEYSIKTGNLTLYFKAKSPAEAETILGYYVNDLHEKLRSREVQTAGAAIDSMKAEARVTSDALLQTQLYELIAHQMQELRLAQVEADFAFSVLEPPAAPDKPYSPDVLLDCVVAGFLTLVLMGMIAMFRTLVRTTDETRTSKLAHATERR